MTQVELTEMKNTAPMKNTPGGIKSRLDTAEEKVSELEDIAIETIQNELKGKLRQKQSISNL